MDSVDNDAGLTWLEGALDYAFVQGKPELWAYLEAVIDDVLFEMELDTLAASQHALPAMQR